VSSTSRIRVIMLAKLLSVHGVEFRAARRTSLLVIVIIIVSKDPDIAGKDLWDIHHTYAEGSYCNTSQRTSIKGASSSSTSSGFSPFISFPMAMTACTRTAASLSCILSRSDWRNVEYRSSLRNRNKLGVVKVSRESIDQSANRPIGMKLSVMPLTLIHQER
jgi:hypothetical protein